MAVFHLFFLALFAPAIPAQPTTSEQWLSYEDALRQNSLQYGVLLQKMDRLEKMLVSIQSTINGGVGDFTTPSPSGHSTSPRPQIIDNSIRLVGGDGRSRGRLEVRHNNRWGTVCDDGFGGSEATVVCRSLGFSAGLMVSSSRYGAGTLDILMDDVNCNGPEERLFDCTHNGWGSHNCGHSEDVGVECYAGPLGTTIHYIETVERDLNTRGVQYLGYISADEEAAERSCIDLLTDLPGGFTSGQDFLQAGGNFGCWKSTQGLEDSGRLGACQPNYQQQHSLADCQRCTHLFVCLDYPGTEVLRLTGSSQPDEGRVEVFYNGWWGTICNADFGIQEAMVMCRGLGHPLGFPAPLTNYGEGTGPIWLSTLQCSGEESNLLECENPGWGVQSCTHARDAAVKCAQGPCGSRMHYLGRVGPRQAASGFDDICYISRAVDTEHISTPCRDLVRDILGSYANADALRNAGGTYGCYRGSGTLGDVNREVACSALANAEQSLSTCIGCTVMFVCIDYPSATTIRLVGGGGPHEGRVEISRTGSWGTVCDDDFSDTDATVVCRSLGYHYGIHRPSAAFGEGSGQIWLDNIRCSGNETRLEQCGHQGWGSHNCGHGEDVGVVCKTLAAI